MSSIDLQPTRCAVCRTAGNATELYKANFDFASFNPIVFSARRSPDRVHYRVVRCNTCGLVRSDPTADSELLKRLYEQSSFNYDYEVSNLRKTYGRYLTKLNKYVVGKGTFLELGCGNGFFLEEALAQGYSNVQGVEPSGDAIAKAKPEIRRFIINDVMREGLFDAEQFNVICMFQLLDHIPDPDVLLEECFRVLKPSGFVLCINHNIDAFSSRLLKSKSPIIDIEHTYFFSPDTVSKIFMAHGFQIKGLGSALNVCSLYYLTHLMPLPKSIKHLLLTLHKMLRRISLRLPLGNLYVIAQKGE